MKVFLKVGKLNGYCKLYYENGKIKSDYLYKNGKLSGNHKEYDENSKKLN